MPSSIPSPARRIGTTSGRGSAIARPLVVGDRGLDRDRLGAHVARRLVGEQGHELFGERAERRRRRRLVAQHRELVGDEGVVGDVDSHTLNATSSGGGWQFGWPMHEDAMRARARRGAARARLGRRAGRRRAAGCRRHGARARGRNEREQHGTRPRTRRCVAIRRAAELRGDWHLDDTTLVVTLEPCVLCAGAILAARIPRLVFGAWDEKAGAVGSVYDVLRDRRCRTASRSSPACSPTSAPPCSRSSSPTAGRPARSVAVGSRSAGSPADR